MDAGQARANDAVQVAPSCQVGFIYLDEVGKIDIPVCLALSIVPLKSRFPHARYAAETRSEYTAT